MTNITQQKIPEKEKERITRLVESFWFVFDSDDGISEPHCFVAIEYILSTIFASYGHEDDWNVMFDLLKEHTLKAAKEKLEIAKSSKSFGLPEERLVN